MRKIIFLIFILIPLLTFSQIRGLKIGYIDMEYILSKYPDYLETKNLLDQKALLWKQEIDAKKNTITSLKEKLQTERVLLTKELVEEKEEEISFLETELSDYQQKRFGPNGDLVVQKTVMVKPLQDQVFTVVQDIAEAQKYDFVFDRSSDLTMLFAAKRFDLSDRVLKQLQRAGSREKLSKKQANEMDEKDKQEEFEAENPQIAEKKKIQEEKQEQRAKALEEKKEAAAKRRKEYLENRQKLIDERNAKKNGTVSANEKANEKSNLKSESNSDKEEVEKEEVETSNINPKQENNAQESVKDNGSKEQEKAKVTKPATIEERKAALEERKNKILADRAKAREERENKQKEQKKD